MSHRGHCSGQEKLSVQQPTVPLLAVKPLNAIVRFHSPKPINPRTEEARRASRHGAVGQLNVSEFGGTLFKIVAAHPWHSNSR
ncbi:hypothetical protein MPTK1_4g19970 [Marchantia polymorpha subsp. ruderalis]|uniref:Uncharacterized protein n=2 Tax=Marchantia polymorpha TaxID=3197 RepID=A0AAF6BBT8_MARPO|nr:hypothetical protein MARPO_0787s0002 [Marchantia polymorpha]BBN09469.1 hypothetical protein Mp_4g19970 [Marchantia polymorpha subsp. ruderalis]PTQ26635.1 hypothetical protein MARPO_0787s0002 [Marchantia polymorpha]PTQ26636.1 hypothetical protein MARPO_0787s0002 [Marchantia polymorpha]PTQ26637.1 hypothetical protein MARPO_0787s0002 [Marchantia polymorpha]|eukprot:PTQ26634.1 hypothetical protein MARPO_0787s0002 [Marchantia polymorpha]